MSKLFDRIMAGLEDALEYAQGDKSKGIVYTNPPKERGECVGCGAELDGGGIWQHFYDKAREDGMSNAEAEARADEVCHHYGASREKGRWGVAIAVSDPERDSVTAYQCPHCCLMWSRTGQIIGYIKR